MPYVLLLWLLLLHVAVDAAGTPAADPASRELYTATRNWFPEIAETKASIAAAPLIFCLQLRWPYCAAAAAVAAIAEWTDAW